MKAKALPPIQSSPLPPLWSALTHTQQQQLARLFAHLLRQMRPTPKPPEGASHE